tara:strand:+ start:484 stop:2274 length:1791 start_codon:yes stop_codon:yes gene_type:complete
MAIEILENTLLKLLVRRGTNSDRQQIVLQSGELGFTTDTERLYIGNSVDKGGVIVGNKYKGSAASISTLTGVVTGDYYYDTAANALKVCVRGTGAEAGDWITVANQISAGDTTLTIDSESKIRVGTSPGGGLSAANIDFDALGKSHGGDNFGCGLTLDDSLRATLSSTISIDRITSNHASELGKNYLGLPSTLNIAGVNYTFPTAQPLVNQYLGWIGNDDDAQQQALQWSSPGVVLAGVAPTTAAMIPVGSILPYASGGGNVPWGWLLCNGQAVNRYTYTDLLSVIGTSYGVGDGSTTFNIPDLKNKLLYSNSNPPTSTLFGVTTGASTTHGSELSATGMQFIIKGIGGVTSPTMTVGKNLSAWVGGVDKTDIEFNPLSGAIVIERPPPGQVVFRDPLATEADRTFTMPAGISYVKYYVTGSGARGGNTIGGAAATCIGYISAAPETEFIVSIGSGNAVTETEKHGNPSTIWTPGGSLVALVQSNGGLNFFVHTNGSYGQDAQRGADGGYGDGIITLASPYILNGEVILGGSGSVPTNNANSGRGHGFVRENRGSVGAASYWGTSPAPGAGQAGFNSQPQGQGHPPTAGIVMFEWN